ncbi:MAG: glycosyltransferase family 2 protein [Primorskyibacter sp.]
MRFSVVIPHLNQPEFLRRCLASLQAGTRQPDEIFVVDNGSAEMPEAICAAVPGVTLLREETPGPGPARNLGVQHATGDVLAFIDADCLADPIWLEVAAREMADPATEILGGDVRIAYDDPDHLTTLEAYESIYAYRMDRYIKNEGFTGTGNLVVRRAVLEAVGPFAGLSVAEDIDWGKRATGAGHSLRYVADMKAYHPARKTYDELWQKWDRHLAHFFTTAQAKRGGMGIWAVKTVIMGLSPLGELPQILTTDRVQRPGDRWRAFVGVTKVRLYRARVMLRLLLKRDPETLSNRWNRTSS